jgi:hypothetical protein
LRAKVFHANGRSSGSVSGLLKKPAHPEAEPHKLSVRLPMLRAVFEQLDGDASGSVNASEVAGFGQYVGQTHWTPEGMALVMDTDGDGTISLAEFQV